MVKARPIDPLSFLHSRSRGDGKVTIGITGLLWPSVDMVARLKLKQIYGRAPKGIKLVAQFNQTWEFY